MKINKPGVKINNLSLARWYSFAKLKLVILVAARLEESNHSKLGRYKKDSSSLSYFPTILFISCQSRPGALVIITLMIVAHVPCDDRCEEHQDPCQGQCHEHRCQPQGATEWVNQAEPSGQGASLTGQEARDLECNMVLHEQYWHSV